MREVAKRGRTWPRRWRLVAVCAVVNSLAAGLIVLFGPADNAAIAPQAAAPPPLGLFFDLRWLLVDARSWLTFAVGAAVLLLLRSLLSAWQANLAWPGRPPPFGQLALRAAIFNVLTGVLLFPFALLLFALGAFSLSWLYLAAVPAALVV